MVEKKKKIFDKYMKGRREDRCIGGVIKFNSELYIPSKNKVMKPKNIRCYGKIMRTSKNQNVMIISINFFEVTGSKVMTIWVNPSDMKWMKDPNNFVDEKKKNK